MNDLEHLAVLDPVRDREPTPMEWARSRAFVDRTVAGEVADTRMTWRRRVMAGAVTVAAGVAAAVAVPALMPGNSAIASWTAMPTSRTGEQVLPQAENCGKGDTGGTSDTVQPSDVILAEQRGEATMIIMRKTTGVIVECLGVGDAGMASMSLIDENEVQAPPAGTLTLETRSSYGDGDDMWSNIVGLAGPGVTSVELRLNDGATVHASVRGGWWGAWWPGPEGGAGPNEFTVRIHAADGVRDVLPNDLP